MSLRAEGERAREVARAELDARVLQAARKAGGVVRAAPLAEDLRATTAAVTGALVRLELAGVVVRVGAGRWRAAPVVPGLVVVPASELADLRERLAALEDAMGRILRAA